MDSSEDKLWLKRVNKLDKITSNHVRSDGVHACGFNMTNRLFGGHTVGQSYLSFKLLYPNTIVIRIDTNFISPGDISHPLDYHVNGSTINNGYTVVNVMQRDKLVALINIRFTNKISLPRDSIYLKMYSEFPSDVLPPSNYTKLIRKDTLQPFTDKPTRVDEPLFEIRPIDSGKFLFYDDAYEPALAWIRANPKLSNVQREDISYPIGIPLVMTDFFIFHPSISIYNAHEQIHQAVTGSSLNHKVTIHASDEDIDPFGFFLIQLKCNTISRQNSIIDGQLFDENKRLILTYRQQNYYTS